MKPSQSSTFRGAIAAAIALAAVAAAGVAIAQMPQTAAPEGAMVYFITPIDDETLSSPLTVRFGLKGMGVAPAGVDVPNTGHHHLIVDAPLPDPSLPIPNDATHRHFGAGQTEVEIELPPGKHTLQLLVGDKNHMQHRPPVASEQITITVK